MTSGDYTLASDLQSWLFAWSDWAGQCNVEEKLKEESAVRAVKKSVEGIDVE